MLGHFVNNLSPAEEHRILVGKLGLFDCRHSCESVPSTQAGCIQQVAGMSAYDRETSHRRDAMLTGRWIEDARWYHDVGLRYDRAVIKFGVARVANAIRNRIFSNQVRRKLAQPQYVSA